MELEMRTEKSAPEGGLCPPYTEKWMVRRITEDDPLRIRTHFRQWINEKRHLEIDEGLIQHLKGLPRDELEKALRELKGKKKFVKGYKGNQISVPVTIQTEDMVTQFRVTSLIDSGCTKSCIDAGLVERFKIPKKKLRVPMPVYNADGTLNQLGKITEYVEVRMMVGDHSERIQLAVTKLGNPELFLGMDWLKDHNPSVDWTQGKLSFDRCPDA